MLKNSKSILLLFGIVLISFTMRAPVSAVGPLVGEIQSDLLLSARAAGMITTIPVILFALVSAYAGKLVSRFRAEAIVLVSLILIASGSAVRSYLGIWGLYAGTAALGLGIGTLNVLQPAMIREKFQDRIGAATGLYSASMTVFSAAASGAVLPLSRVLGGWRHAVSIWGILSVFALIVWLVITKIGLFAKKQTTKNGDPEHAADWKDRRLWFIALFMGLQATLYFCMISWLPSILGSKPVDPRTPGYLMLMLQLLSLITNFTVPVLTQKCASRAPIAVGLGIGYFAGLALVLVGTSLPVLIIGCALIGLASGACIGYALTLIGMNGKTPRETARLSGFSHMIGYALAAVGPVLLGAVYDFLNAWTVPVIILMFISVLALFVGIKAGKRTEA